MKNFLALSAGFFLILAPYQIFCLLKYKAFFPTYWHMAKNQDLAAFFWGGRYSAGKYFLIANTPENLLFFDYLNNTTHHIWGFIKQMFLQMPLLIPFVLLKPFLLPKKNKAEIIFLAVALSNIFLYSLEHINISSGVVALRRYSLNFIPFLVPLGISMLIKLGGIIEQKYKQNYQKLFLPFMITLIFLPNIQGIKKVNTFAITNIKKSQAIEKEQKQIADWLNKHTPAGKIIAIEGFLNPLYIKNPAVNMPRYKLLNSKNLIDFVRIIKPEYIVTTKITPKESLRKIAYLFKPAKINQKTRYFKIFLPRLNFKQKLK